MTNPTIDDSIDKILWPYPFDGKPYQITVSGKVGEPVYNLSYSYAKKALLDLIKDTETKLKAQEMFMHEAILKARKSK